MCTCDTPSQAWTSLKSFARDSVYELKLSGWLRLMLTDHAASGRMHITDVDRAVQLAQRTAYHAAESDQADSNKDPAAQAIAKSALLLDYSCSEGMRSAVMESLVQQAAQQAAAGNSSAVVAAVQCLAQHAYHKARSLPVHTLCVVLASLDCKHWPEAKPALKHMAEVLHHQLKTWPVQGRLLADESLLVSAAKACKDLGIKDAAIAIKSECSQTSSSMWSGHPYCHACP